MDGSLKSKTVHGVLWSFLERVGQQGMQVVIWIILARLLLPKEFGLVAMLMIFTMIGQKFLDSGFGSALIQKKEATHVDCCSIFYFNIVFGIMAAGLLCLTAPWIAGFYGEPILVPLVRVLSLNLIVNAFGLVQTSLLIKHIDFKTQLKVSMIATTLSGGIAITMAYQGFGVWSLVVRSVTDNLFRTVLLWLFNNWRPSLVFSFTALKSMFHFGSRLMLSGFINAVFQNIYLVIIGRIFTATDLGFYSRAKHFQRVSAENLTSSVSRVIFPAFSTVQNDNTRFKRGMQKTLAIMVFLNFPLMVGLLVTARPLVLVLLTEKWLPCVPYLQLLCVIGLLHPLQVINLTVLIAKGRSDLFLRLEIFKSILVIISVAVTYRWGIAALIYGHIGVSILGYYLNSYYTGKLINYPMKKQVFDFAPYLGLSAIMGIAIYCFGLFPFPNNWSLLICQVLAGFIIYVVINRIFRTSAFSEIVDLLKDALRPRISQLLFLRLKLRKQ